MGGLARRMPITFITYLIGTLALSGIFPLAGFWSKDEILGESWLRGLEGGTFLKSAGGYIAFILLLAAAAFTAFYMWRQIEMVFFGQARTEAADHAAYCKTVSFQERFRITSYLKTVRHLITPKEACREWTAAFRCAKAFSSMRTCARRKTSAWRPSNRTF